MSARAHLRLLQGGLASATLMTEHLASEQRGDRKPTGAPTLFLGNPGSCPDIPTLLIALFDDSPSVTAPGGTDPISARYDEAGQALSHLARHCTCGQCRAAVIHFDLVDGCEPVRLGGRKPARRNRLPQELVRSLRVPSSGSGCSELGAALEQATLLIEASPDCQVSVIVFSDFELLDADPGAVLARLAELDADVHAVLLADRVDPARLDARVHVTQIDWDDAPGAAARALMDSLTRRRHGARLPPLPPRPS